MKRTLLPLRRYANLLSSETVGMLCLKNCNLIGVKSEHKTVYGWHTIKQGERAAVWYLNGTMKFVEGPERVLLFGGSVQTLVKKQVVYS